MRSILLPGMMVLTILCTVGAPGSVASSFSRAISSGSVASSVQGHDTCYHNHAYYKDFFDKAAEENCHTPYSMFRNLDYIRRHDQHCLPTLIRAIAKLHLPSCRCTHAQVHYPHQGDYHHYSRCMNHHVYREVANTYLTYYQNGRSTTVTCHSRNRAWRDLVLLLNDRLDCLFDFVSQMKVAYDHNHEPPCQTCHVYTHTQVTQPPHHQLTHNELYQAYQKGECLSEHTVWEFLYHETGYQHGLNREQVIAQMATHFPKGINDQCICNKAVDLHYHNSGGQDGIAWHCSNLQEDHSYPYRTAISHLLNQINFVHSSTQRCHSHTAVWWELDHIVKHNHHGKICVENLIHHMYDAVHRQGDPCSCHAATVPPTTKTTQPTTITTTTTTTTQAPTTTYSTTSTTKPTVSTTIKTTQPISTTTLSRLTTTTSELTTKSNNTSPISHSTTHRVLSTPGQSTECSRIRTVEELGKFHQLYPQFNADCSNHVSTSNLIVRELCDFVPNSLYWRPGTKVVDACDTLQTYQPVATFSSAIFPVDGLAGIFLGCTSTSIRIATQECGGTFKILELSRHPMQSERFTHTASNYYVISYLITT